MKVQFDVARVTLNWLHRSLGSPPALRSMDFVPSYGHLGLNDSATNAIAAKLAEGNPVGLKFELVQKSAQAAGSRSSDAASVELTGIFQLEGSLLLIDDFWLQGQSAVRTHQTDAHYTRTQDIGSNSLGYWGAKSGLGKLAQIAKKCGVTGIKIRSLDQHPQFQPGPTLHRAQMRSNRLGKIFSVVEFGQTIIKFIRGIR